MRLKRTLLLVLIILVCEALIALLTSANTSAALSATSLRESPQTSQAAKTFDGIRQRIQEAVKNDEAVSMAVAVAVDGKIIWEEGFGSADREQRIRATAHTRYAIGSISKPFTATGLMILVERGLVDLNRPANQYLGGAQITGYAGSASEATVKLILQHRSGLPYTHQFFYEDENYTRPDMDETIRRYGILVNPPGERYIYANIDYGILEHISARVSGKSYPDFMRAEVFLPLGLTRTSIGPIKNETARLYTADRTPIPFYDFATRGDGYIYSSAHDVVRFGMFHLKEHLPDQRQILKDSTIDQMVSDNHTTGSVGGLYGTDWFYGLGWGGRERSEYSYHWFGHDGGMPGASSDLKIIPSKRIVVVALSNSRQALTSSIVNSIIDVLLPDYAKMRQLDPTVISKPPQPPPFTPTQEFLGEWRGEVRTWSGTLPVTMVFQADGDVHIKVGEQFETLLNNIRFEDGVLSGRSFGTLPTEDASRRPHDLRFSLTLRGNALSGTVTAASTSRRDYFYLPSWVALVKQPLNK